MDQALFEKFYQSKPPWDIDGPQPIFKRLEQDGQMEGSVLDVGCGTGENALYLASRGHEVWGVDFVPFAIESAQQKAKQRGVKVNFQVADALSLQSLGRTFDVVIDSGLFHTFDDSQRAPFTASLASVLRPGGLYYMLCFSDAEPGTEGPRRISQKEIQDTFKDGWEVKSIQPMQFQVNELPPDMPRFTPGGPHGWVVTIERKRT